MQIVRNQHDDGITQRSREDPLSMVHADVQMDEDEPLAIDQVNDTGDNEVDDTSLEPMSVPFRSTNASMPLIY